MNAVNGVKLLISAGRTRTFWVAWAVTVTLMLLSAMYHMLMPSNPPDSIIVSVNIPQVPLPLQSRTWLDIFGLGAFGLWTVVVWTYSKRFLSALWVGGLFGYAYVLTGMAGIVLPIVFISIYVGYQLQEGKMLPAGPAENHLTLLVIAASGTGFWVGMKSGMLVGALFSGLMFGLVFGLRRGFLSLYRFRSHQPTSAAS